jgi:hypothetical protein
LKLVERLPLLPSSKGNTMRVLKRIAVAVAASAVMLTTVATPAHAMYYVNPVTCTWNYNFGAHDYFFFKIYVPRTGSMLYYCYADAGYEFFSVHYQNVSGISSGNNEGLIEYKVGGTWYLYHFDKWHEDLNYYGEVAMLTIY